MNNNIENKSLSKSSNINKEEVQSQQKDLNALNLKRSFCIYNLKDMMMPIVEKRYEKLSSDIIGLQKIVTERNYSNAKIKSLFAKSATEEVFIIRDICKDINRLTNKFHDKLMKISSTERKLRFSRDPNNKLPYDWDSRDFYVKNHVKSFIDFIQIVHSFLDLYYEIESKDFSDYDSQLQYLTDVSEQYVVLGETINYFFNKLLYELKPYIPDDMLGLIYDYFYMNASTTEPIKEKSSSMHNYKFDEQTINAIREFYRRNENIKCTESNFAAMFENADFSPLMNDNGTTPTIVCLAIYCFHTYIYKGADRKEWFKYSCSSINKNGNTVRTKAHTNKEELEFWRKKK